MYEFEEPKPLDEITDADRMSMFAEMQEQYNDDDDDDFLSFD